jgi:DNA repair protein SbcC/Rad50
MIKSLHITNFQPHEDTILDFSNGVNVIIGSSDSGKTSIIRSIRKVVWNRPSGDSFCSNWGGETKIQLQTEDGSVTWLKDKMDKYILETGGVRQGDKRNKTEFKAIGTGVPEEISRFLNINEVNLQSQLDSPFLLSETPGAVAQHFNKVARLDKIDKSTSNVNSEISELNAEIGKEATKDKPATGLIKLIKEAEEELTKYQYLEKFEIEVEVLEELDKRLVRNCTSYDKLGKLIDSYSARKILIGELEIFTQLEPVVDHVLVDIDELKKQEKQWNKLHELIAESSRLKKEKIRLSELTELEEPVDNLLIMYKELETRKSLKMRLSKAITNLNYINTQIEVYKTKHTRLLKEFTEGMGAVCILCGSKLK